LRGFLLLLLLLSVLPAEAVTRYLSPTGTDSGACTNSGARCKTMQYVNSQIPSGGGDTVEFADGVYNDSGDAVVQPKSNTTWRSTNMHGATIKTGYPSTDEAFLLPNGAHDITIERFIFDGSGPGGGCPNPENRCTRKAVESQYSPQVAANHNYNITFRDNIVHDTRQSAVLIVGHHVTLTRNEIYNVGIAANIAAPDYRGDHGCYFSVNNGEVSYNYFHDILGYACQIFASAADITVSDNLIMGNIFKNTSLGVTTQGTRHTIVNNLSIRDGGVVPGSPVSYTIISDNTKFWNNTVIDRQINAARSESDVSSNEFINNIVCFSGTAFDMTNPVRRNNTTSCPTGTFANAGSDDYHLAASTPNPPRDGGEPGLRAFDLEQCTRPYPAGGAWDRGAYEYGSCTGATAVATSLGFGQQPSSTQVNGVISPPITVLVLDQAGNPMNTGTQAITLSFNGTPPAGAVLSGTLTQNAVNGVATFNNLSINVVGSYQLKAAATLNAVAVQTLSTTFSITAPGTAPNVLRVHVSNPRYFQTAGGPAIILTGSHTWCSLANYFFAGNNETCTLDYPAYLNFLQARNHNFMKLWRFDLIGMEIHPWARSTTVCCAADGQNKLDFNVFDEAWFDRLRSRIIAAGQQGIYASVLFFDGTFSESWWSEHLMNPNNNVQGIDGGGSSTQTEANTAKLTVQETFIKHVIDKINDLVNVLYEIANEGGTWSLAWQNRMVDLIHSYEAGKPKQHPVGITALTNGTFSDVNSSTSHAEWTSPGGTGGCPEYRDDPPAHTAAAGTKVILTDSDHCGMAASESGSPTVVWKNFTRGHQMLLMETPDLLTNSGREPARKAAGQTRLWADSVPLANMTPQNSLASTGYALAQAGVAYIVWQPGSGGFTVTLPGTSATYSVTWWREDTQVEVSASNFTGSGTQTFTPPFSGAGALRLVATTVNLSPLALGGPGRPGTLAAPLPVVLTHPVLRGMSDWFRVTPPWAGGPRWYSLLSARTGTLTNMGASTGWHGTRRVGGQGEMAFDGSDDLVSLPPSIGTFTGTGQYSWAFWLRPESFAQWQTVVAAVVTPGNEPAGVTSIYAHSTTATDWGPVTNGLSVGFNTGSTNTIRLHSTDNALTLSTWAYVVVTYDGTLGASSRTAIYVNGADVTATGDVAVVGTLGTMTPTVVNLGSDTFGDPTFAGAMDDVQVWTRPLSASEVRALSRLSQQGWPGVLRRQDDLVSLGPGTPTPPSGRKGAFFPMLQPEQPRGR